jgi:predicted nucleic acid-binding protein
VTTFIDANILLRFLVKAQTAADQARQANCANLFNLVRDGATEITTCESVIAEVLFVLCSPRQYGLTHQDASARLRPLLSLRGFRLPQKRVYFRALDLFATYPHLDYPDTLLIAQTERAGLQDLLSYDRGLDRVPSITRREP